MGINRVAKCDIYKFRDTDILKRVEFCSNTTKFKDFSGDFSGDRPLRSVEHAGTDPRRVKILVGFRLIFEIVFLWGQDPSEN